MNKLPKVGIWCLALLATSMYVTAEDYTYTTNSGTITITGYIGPGGDVIIPDTINGLSVTTIGESAFSYSDLTSAIISSNVTYIGRSAFYQCENLTSLSIPDNVIFIGNSAFSLCFDLKNLEIGASVTSIGRYAFDGCESLTSITIPDSVTFMGEAAFRFCTSLTNITIGNSISSIEIEAFTGCSGLKSITIPDSVTSIEYRAFMFCSRLTSLTIGNGVTNFGNFAFDWCTNLTGVYLKGNSPAHGSSVFTGADQAIVYYLPGTTGWETTYAGRPTQLWNPAILTDDGYFGTQGNEFCFNIAGTSNELVKVEACTNLVESIWEPIITHSLSNGAAWFSDPGYTNHPTCFYRLDMP